ncbi:Putative membrane protein, DoxD family [Halorhabdus sp. SVX81]|uniref:DoxX family protein n=1 Tax=Halorhabdus sp. SVX81 TaxID=2978283 RepID=UPI0023DA141E|nr:DoxX family protein [Halorhabdus sp. SVX81]WEL17923.1 Putative membrane protein, DoxD family [Halorhabdus sp. SVX81]
MAFTGSEGLVLLAGRILFGVVLAFMGLNHFMQREQMTGYAEYKGLPAPGFSVIASGVVLIAGGLAVVAGVYPVVGAVALAGFLLISALTMHDFWAVPEDDQQDEMTAFLKNLVMAGGALVVAAVGTQSWAYSIGIGLF